MHKNELGLHLQLKMSAWFRAAAELRDGPMPTDLSWRHPSMEKPSGSPSLCSIQLGCQGNSLTTTPMYICPELVNFCPCLKKTCTSHSL